MSAISDGFQFALGLPFIAVGFVCEFVTTNFWIGRELAKLAMRK